MRHWQVSLFAMMLAAAGLPLYIHLPRFASTELGLSLATVGGVLIAIRVLDFVQDPLLGRLIDRYPGARGLFAGLAVLGMAAGFVMLFSLPPQTGAATWLVLALVPLFTAYSLGSILFYGQSAAIAGSGEARALYRLAGWREGGMLAGVILAASAPAALAALGAPGGGYPAFGWLLAAMAFGVGLVTRPLWRAAGQAGTRLTLSGLTSSGGGWLLVLALVNSLPVAVTSTLFLFFVEDRLQLRGLAGLFLILFFLSAGFSVPVWTRLVARRGARRVLVPAMGLAIAGFIGAAALPEGAALGFALICIGSGAALGADMVILPALFSAVLARAGLQAGQAFGLWSFASKMALALAAVTMLPLLDLAGFRPGEANGAEALTVLTAAYALLPCLLKLLAIRMVVTLPERALA